MHLPLKHPSNLKEEKKIERNFSQLDLQQCKKIKSKQF
jgi:hypothetical protein